MFRNYRPIDRLSGRRYSRGQSKEAFKFPILAMVAVGYQAEPEVLPNDVKAKELTPRKRKPLGECFFAGDWGKPYTG